MAHPTDRAGGLRPEPVAPSQPVGAHPLRGIAKQIEAALYECAGKATPVEIRIGYTAWDALRADPDASRWMSVGPTLFQGVPVTPLPPREMPLTLWEVVPARCEHCRGGGRVMAPFLLTAQIDGVVLPDFGTVECPDCQGKPLPSIRSEGGASE